APAAPCRRHWPRYCPAPTTCRKPRDRPRLIWSVPLPRQTGCRSARVTAPYSISTHGGKDPPRDGTPCYESVQCAGYLFDLFDAMTATGLSETELARFNMIEQQIRP